MIFSPLTNGPTRCVGQISTSDIIAGYQKEFGIDVSDYFKGIPVVWIHECRKSGYRFYSPFTLVGRSDLYEQLQKFYWNRVESKWEFVNGLKYIAKSSKVLDVGCGDGAFLNLCRKHEFPATGLELNPVAASIGISKGLEIKVETLNDHAHKNPAVYDVITSFQVLEHIADPKSFILDCARLLRDGGKLIIGVPNNGAFLKYDRNAVLNMPPHHMGLWTRQSLKSIQEYFPFELVAFQEEPLTEIDWYAAVQVKRFLKIRLLQRIYYRLKVDRPIKKLIEHFASKLHGHTIIAVYKKINRTASFTFTEN